MKISHHRHTGRLQARHHTSYAASLFSCLLAGLVLLIYTSATLAQQQSSSGSINVSGVVPAPPPQQGAVITSPVSGQRFSALPIEVRGTCPPDLLVKIFKNNVLAGSTFCDSSGHFRLLIDLFLGRNDLVARVFDALNQPGPDSPTVTVYYEPPSGISPPTQLILKVNSDYRYQGIFPNNTLRWPAEIMGGQAPYAISWDWGDGSQADPISLTKIGSFTAEHVYQQPGTYKVVIRATDTLGQAAHLELVVIVNGIPPANTVDPNPVSGLGGYLMVAWPLFIVLLLILVSFWLGEKHEKKLLSENPLTT